MEVRPACPLMMNQRRTACQASKTVHDQANDTHGRDQHDAKQNFRSLSPSQATRQHDAAEDAGNDGAPKRDRDRRVILSGGQPHSEDRQEDRRK